MCLVIVTSEHSVVLSQCSGVALLSNRQQKQNWFTSGSPAYRPVQLTNAGGQHCLYTAGTSINVDIVFFSFKTSFLHFFSYKCVFMVFFCHSFIRFHSRCRIMLSRLFFRHRSVQSWEKLRSKLRSEARQWSSGGHLTNVRRPQQVRKRLIYLCRHLLRTGLCEDDNVWWWFLQCVARVHYREGSPHAGSSRQPQLWEVWL